MLKLFLISIGFLLTAMANAQTENRFEYKLTPYGDYMVTPLFDTTKMEGKHGLCQFLDQAYVDSTWDKIIKSSIPDGKLKAIQHSAVIVYINTIGEVLNVRFLVHEKDKELITEDELYTIYMKFRQLRLDTAKVIILDPQNQAIKLTSGMLLYQDYSNLSNTEIFTGSEKQI